MTISANSTLTTQFTPDFKLENLVNGQILIYNDSVAAFVNTSSLQNTGVVITTENIADKSVGLPQLNTVNSLSVGAVLGVDVNGNLAYITLSGTSTASLSGLLDTAILTPAVKQYLRYDGSIWKNQFIAINDVSEIVVSSPASGEVLRYNGSNWVNAQLQYADVSGTPTIPVNNDFSFVGLSDTNNTPVANGYLLWNGSSTEIIYSATIPATSITGLSTVATTGVYADLLSKPNLAVYATYASLSPVATSGDYADLTNTPFIPTNLPNLADVNIPVTPLNGQFLRYNSISSKWENSTVSVVQNLEDLNDVAYTSLATGDFLKWDGSKWTDSVITWSDITSVPSTFTPAAHVHSTSDITGLAAFIVGENSSFQFKLLSDVNPTFIANAYLKFDGTATTVTYASNIPATDISGLATVAISGSYADLSNTPALATVATSGLYSDLSGSPTIPSSINDLSDVTITIPTVKQVIQYNGVVWGNATLSYNDLANLPTLFSGSYTDLTNVPSTFTPSLHTHVMADITNLSIPSVLEDLTNVSTNTPLSGQYLVWNSGSSKWTPTTLNISSKSIDDLSDVTLTSPVSTEVLKYNGSAWVNAPVNYSELSGVPSTFTPSTHAHATGDITGLYAWLVSQNAALNLTGLGDTTSISVSNAYLKWNGAGTTVVYVSTIPATDITGLATVATSGDYADLINSPTIPSNNSFSFLGLSDTNNTAVVNGYLRWDGTASQIVYSATIPYSSISGLATVASTGSYADLINTPAIPSIIDDLSDVTITTPVNNEYLKYFGGVWVNSAIQHSDIANPPSIPAIIDDLSDVTITAPSNGQYLKYLGGTWQNFNIQYSEVSGTPTNNSYTFVGLSDTNNTVVANGFLRWNNTGTEVEYVTISAATDITGLATVATTGDYADLINAPTIPTNNTFTFVGLSDTNNTPVANGYLLWNGATTEIVYSATIPAASVSGLSTVATTGDYSDLINSPIIPVNNDFSFVGLNDTNNTPVNNGFVKWNNTGTSLIYDAAISAGVITGLAGVATSGLLSSLSDATITSPVTTQVLKYNGSAWVNSYVSYAELTGVPSTFTPAPHTHNTSDISGLAQVAITNDYNDLSNLPTVPTNLNSLTDVIITAPASGQVVRYNGTNWVNAALSYSDLTGTPTIPSTLDSLSDVTAPSPTSGNVLTWNGSAWVPSSAFSTVENLSNTANTAVSNGYLRWNTNATQVVYETTISASNISGLSVVATSGDIGSLVNVDTTGALTGYVLVYNSTTGKWVAQVNTGSSVNTLNLTDLADVTISTPIVGEVLRYNGSQWVDSKLDFSDLNNAPTNNSYTLVGLSDTSNTIISNGFLRWNSNGSQVIYQAAVNALTDISNLATVATSGNYSDLINSPTVPVVLNDLSNVNTGTPGNGDVLTYSTALSKWIANPAGTVSLTLDALSNVVVPTPTVSQTITWNGLNWVNSFVDYSTLLNKPTLATVATSGSYNDLLNLPAYTFVSLNDTNNTVVNNGFLRWNGAGSQINYQATVDATTDISNLATVAVTGAYADLSGTPANTVVGLNDTANVIVNNGFLRWNNTGTSVDYVILNTSMVSGLATVGSTGLLKDLADVTAPTPANGDILVYDTGTSKWVAQSQDSTVYWSIITTNTAAVNKGAYLVNTSSSSITITLPASPGANHTVRVVDYAGTFGTYNCVINRNGKPIMGEAKDLTLARNNTSIVLTFVDNTQGWKITSGLGEEPQWVQITGNYTAKPGDALLANTSSGGFTVTLPSYTTSRINDRVRVADMVGTFGAGKKCTISSDTNIMGLNQSLEITASNASVELTYIGGTQGWKVTQGVGEILTKANDILIDTNIYVTTAGNDLTGDGSQAYPYATLGGALTALDHVFISSSAFVTINIAQGEYTSGSTTDIYQTYGNRIKITGEAPTVTATISSVSGTPTTTSFKFNVGVGEGSQFTSGDYIVITSTTGTGEHSIVRGVYKVESVVSDTLEINLNYMGLVADLTGITLTGGIVTKQKTILKYTGVTGIRMRSGNLRLLSHVTIVGNNTSGTHGILSGQVDTDAADSDNTGGTIDLGQNVNITRFAGNGLYATYNGYINADVNSGAGTTITRCGGGMEASYNAVIRSNGVTVTNIVEKGLFTTYGGVIDAASAQVIGCGNEALIVKNGGIIKAGSITVSVKNNLTGSGAAMIYASGTGACFVPNIGSVTYSPTFNTTGNGNAYIGAP